uniref:HIVEP zinc finger 1 n=1 Tax=Sciurus vulgaris TaxID=55149 RepID=A0A8D2CVS8_SCIVU
MLKKHIRTHTDVRPYHCSYCNFSFKTKDEKQRYSYERSGCDLEDSDGPEEDDNENEDDDEDSQAESGLSAAPSVTASPQHLPARSGPQDSASADEDARTPDCFSGAHADPMDVLPRVLLTKMTVLSTVQSDHGQRTHSPAKATQQAASHEAQTGPPAEPSRSLCHQMSVDYPESEALQDSLAGRAITVTQDTSSARLPSAQPAAGAPPVASAPPAAPEHTQQGALPAPAGLPSSHTHLFSHLPLHSQQPARTPCNVVPVGGIHVVPAGLTYSTFVPIQAGPVQLTIPAVSVIHRTVGAPGDTATEAASPAHPSGVAELSSVVPCIPIGQIRVPGLQNLSTPALQSLTSLSMETVNIVGLANTNIAPQAHPPGLALNAVGLQVLTGNAPAQSSAAPQHIPGLQILNIALPTLIPSVGQVALEAQGAPEAPASQSKASETPPQQTSVASAHQVSRTESPQGSPQVQPESAKNVPGPPAHAGDHARLDGSSAADTEKAASASHVKLRPEAGRGQGQPACPAEPLRRARAEVFAKPSGLQTPSPDRQVPRPAAPPQRQPPVPFSDGSSDEDEDRLVIAT